MKIVVLAGGLSPERDVSLVSASMIAKALINQGNEVAVLDLYYGIDDAESLVFSSVSDDIKTCSVSETAPVRKRTDSVRSDIGSKVIECCKKADIVFLALHGDIGENGKVQAVLDVNKIKYTGSGCDGCMLSMDKNLSKILVSAHNIKTPKWCVNIKDSSVSFPCVVKPSGGGSSIGVSVVNNFEELNRAMLTAAEYDTTVLIEEKINGREFSVGVLNNKALPIIEIAPKKGFYDYKNKYQQGLTVETCPANLPPYIAREMQELAVKIHKILHLRFYSRIDFMMDRDNNIYFLEANSLPGMTPVSLLPQEAAANGIEYEELCSLIVQGAF